jgi:hypothetical protein
LTEPTSPSYDDFASRIGETFTVVNPQSEAGTGAQFLLTACSPRVASGGFVSFSVTFSDNSGAAAQQGTLTFSAPGFGPTDVFVVPVRQSDAGVDYEVIFNQLEG